ncbi:MAG: hypothetical protein CL840_20405 [Crocinitomicaceae bacterium]|nr:hypothetical protein [Crocinitomicaceae bacterium]|tara:strand:- start:18954 stop:19751 length:798 start_codon:yes stop_codon:yes gene_type:complete
MHNYNETDKRIHALSQVLAKAGRSFVPKQDDDSHTNLSFEPLDFRVYSRWIETPKGRVILSLNLLNLSFEWQSESKSIILSVPVMGKTMASVEKELEEGIRFMGIENADFSAELHYEIPEYPFLNDPVAAINAEDIKEWTERRRMANMVSDELLRYLQVTAEVRIWPHHFDTGFYTQVSSKMSIGFGWAMKDNIAGNAYFYMSGYSDGGVDYSKVKNLPVGRWEVGEHWNGAVLSLSDFENLLFHDTQPIIIGYLKGASNWFLRA